MYIHCTTHICQETGRHYYYGGHQKVYGMPPDVPEEYRDFVKVSGDLFEIYARFVTDESSTSVENFVDKYPAWSDIIEDGGFETCCHGWNETKHDQFYAALKWFSDQAIWYTISWTG